MTNLKFYSIVGVGLFLTVCYYMGDPPKPPTPPAAPVAHNVAPPDDGCNLAGALPDCKETVAKMLAQQADPAYRARVAKEGAAAAMAEEAKPHGWGSRPIMSDGEWAQFQKRYNDDVLADREAYQRVQNAKQGVRDAQENLRRGEDYDAQMRKLDRERRQNLDQWKADLDAKGELKRRTGMDASRTGGN